MLEMADLPNAEAVIELGPGSGGATKQIKLERVRVVWKNLPPAYVYCAKK
jgi:phospholipid N-methyltransferase